MASCADHLPPIDLTRVSATSVLSGEHRVILQTLSVLERLAGIAAREGRLDADARDALEVLRRFADACHHGKEEKCLFPAIEAIQPGFGPVQVMLAEHVEGRALLSRMAAAIESADPAAFARAAQGYASLLRQHIEKEDQILFRMAGAMLDPEEDRRIVEAYRAVEHDDMGSGTHERMLGLADRLAATHGVPRASDDPTILRLLTAVCGCRTDAP